VPLKPLPQPVAKSDKDLGVIVARPDGRRPWTPRTDARIWRQGVKEL